MKVVKNIILNRVFRVLPDDNVAFGLARNQFLYYLGHIGETFVATKIIRCSEHSGCFNDCPGRVQAPWMEEPRCFGFRDKYRLEEII